MEPRVSGDADCVRGRGCGSPRHQDYHGARPSIGENGNDVERADLKPEVPRLSFRPHRFVDGILCGFNYGQLAGGTGDADDSAVDRVLTNVCGCTLLIGCGVCGKV